MLRLALICLMVAMVSAVLGFGLLADLSFDSAKIAFFVFLALGAVSFVADAFRTDRMIDPV